MKKSITIRIICLAVAFIMLGGAVAYAAITGSPYETLKKAMIDAVTYRNVTVESEMTLRIDGVQQNYMTEKSHYVAGDEAFLAHSYDDFGNIDGYTYISYYGNGLILRLSPIEKLGDTVSYHCSIRQQYQRANLPQSQNTYMYELGDLAIIGPEDKVSASMRFAELLVDTLVGDLKNNITMSTRGDLRIVRGSLTENQIPELINAGLDVLIEGQNDWYDDDYDRDYFEGWESYEIPIKKLEIKYIGGEAEIDADGNLLYIGGVFRAMVTNILDDASEWELEFNVRFSDIGTSAPACPIPGVETLLPQDIDIGNNNRGDVFSALFEVSPDGAIIEDSISPPNPIFYAT